MHTHSYHKPGWLFGCRQALRAAALQHVAERGIRLSNNPGEQQGAQLSSSDSTALPEVRSGTRLARPLPGSSPQAVLSDVRSCQAAFIFRRALQLYNDLDCPGFLAGPWRASHAMDEDSVVGDAFCCSSRLCNDVITVGGERTQVLNTPSRLVLLPRPHMAASIPMPPLLIALAPVAALLMIIAFAAG